MLLLALSFILAHVSIAHSLTTRACTQVSILHVLGVDVDLWAPMTSIELCGHKCGEHVRALHVRSPHSCVHHA